MQFLVAADTHGTLTEENVPQEFLTENIDAVILLGDVLQRDIDILKNKFKVPFFGVGGNHDTWDLMSKNGIHDLHARVIKWKNLIIAGFGGSLRYKETPDYMFFTEQEASDLLAQMPRCDILLTHAGPKYKDEEQIEQYKEAPRQEKESLFDKISSLFTKPTQNPYANHQQDSSAPMYKGFYGIGEYIQKHHPTFVLHGHIHQSDTDWHGQTCVRSFYGLELFELDI